MTYIYKYFEINQKHVLQIHLMFNQHSVEKYILNVDTQDNFLKYNLV